MSFSSKEDLTKDSETVVWFRNDRNQQIKEHYQGLIDLCKLQKHAERINCQITSVVYI